MAQQISALNFGDFQLKLSHYTETYMLKKAAFLSTDNLENFFTYDKLLIEPMKKSGWLAEEISWRDEATDWSHYDAVIVRSTWDYQHDSEKFFRVLQKINSLTHLENDLALMKWNMNKNYLNDLKNKGVLIVNTLWKNKFDRKEALNYFEQLGTEEIIIKPNISASADRTFRLNKHSLLQSFDILENIFTERDFMVQPFIKNIVEEGEYSLFFFNGKLSHSVLKTPKENDFRVQEEHGGNIKPVTASGFITDVAKNVINKLSSVPLYARVDLVRVHKNQFALMELEVIEPSLYLNKDPEAPHKFVKAFLEKIDH
ncbi:MAG: hypothetical protein ROY99_04100 [Ignavibacterium sp.]|nr:hypothetical protein [Ignavibacterium sp.]